MPRRRTTTAPDDIPEQFASVEDAAEFWDSHDLADYWDSTEPARFDVRLERTQLLVALDPDVANRIAAEASRRGLSSETLVNLWLDERLRGIAS
jgi:hypothetical protein